jgi:formylglycine-generating enzyme required for sulfatase activity
MAFVPAGIFTMGDSLDGDVDANPTDVTVSGFYMDVNLVTSNQWMQVYTYATNNGYGFKIPISEGKAANHPIQSVDWFACVKWCNARSQQAALTPVYYTDEVFSQLYTNGENGLTIYANWSANGYRLPTEAEWEKAARGGAIGLRFPWGDTISESQANYYGNTNVAPYDLGPDGLNSNFSGGSGASTSPVGYFAANGYDLNDMAGNVLEWCWDWYGTPYGQPTTTDPTGAATGNQRVLRGGSWLAYANSACCAARGRLAPVDSDFTIGFRCVRPL